ncbi:MAG: 2-oxoacid:acceptor oxidoreductase subunit alpha [Patescibacteria group bacterium]|jgi:2-oxoglutarate ferredoxin oxidoreductase subunit alpha|nr:2-oxoacid:acceptor oxidoreductase subunit alpha [Patescibacteria group bacterium]
MKTDRVLTWKIGGLAGGGQKAAGLIFTKACARAGLFTFDSSEYPSLIRGGLVTYRVSVSSDPVNAIYKDTQLLIALTAEALDYCLPDVTADGVVLYDSDKFKPTPAQIKGRKFYALPLEALAKSAGIKSIAANVIITGACAALLDFDFKILTTVVTESFAEKGKEVVAMNLKALQFGFDYAQNNFQVKDFGYKLKPIEDHKKPNFFIVTANDTLALAAVAAGCNYLVSYPMTPASSILHSLADWAEEVGMIVKQPEDEIGAIHMALGGSFAGARAMTATSGGGFALMVEALTLAAMTETPLVIVESQRPAPATGLPTWTEQGDLSFVAHAGHGDFLRIVLAPGDPEESFYLTAQAFNLAEKWQVPVFILLDKYISEAHKSIIDLDESKITVDRGKMLTNQQLAKLSKFLRYQLTKDGVSPRSVPGQPNGLHIANSDEHDEYGFTIEGFNPQMRNLMMEKRAAKFDGIIEDLPEPELIGPAQAKITLIGWGSVKGPIVEALKQLPDVNYLHVMAPWPLSESFMRAKIKGVKKLIAIENNQSGQFANLLREATGIEVDERLTKYDGAQFFPEEIIDNVNKFL